MKASPSKLKKETPTPAVDNTTTVFTVAHKPRFLTLNGIGQEENGSDYTLTGAGPFTITMVTAPVSTDTLRSFY